MDVYLVDGTYELFRHYHALPKHVNRRGEEVAATRGVVQSVIGMLDSGVSYIGVATDHAIQSFRNELWPGYKTDAGVPKDLLAQFPLLEEAVASLGVTVWPMVELEADDAIAAAAKSLSRFRRVRRVVICSPDKDFAQCVRDDRVVQLDRRAGKIRNERGVVEKFGVLPSSLPDYLALVGDVADGYPGIDGWGEKSASVVLARYRHLERIPVDSTDWGVYPRSSGTLAETLQRDMKLALLFRDLATLRTTEPVVRPDQLLWRGPYSEFRKVCERLDAPAMCSRATELQQRKVCP